MQCKQSLYGKLSSGEAVHSYTLENQDGFKVSLLNYGATLAAVWMKDKDGVSKNILKSYDDISGFENDSFFMGVTVGRFANRIARGKFTLNGQEYSLATNNPPNHLHGGPTGFHTKVWDAELIETDDACSVQFKYTSPDMEEGFPGNMDVVMTYSLNEASELTLDYKATCDKATPVNLTNHAYWNLAGEGDISDHVLKLVCDNFLPVDETSIPLGELASVSGSPMDLTSPKVVGDGLAELEAGYDHCYVVNPSSDELAPAAVLKDPASGRCMDVLTTKPGIQFYSGNFLEGRFKKHEALCLETQFFPDAPNQGQFPTCILNPGETYHHVTVHRFYVS